MYNIINGKIPQANGCGVPIVVLVSFVSGENNTRHHMFLFETSFVGTKSSFGIKLRFSFFLRKKNTSVKILSYGEFSPLSIPQNKNLEK